MGCSGSKAAEGKDMVEQPASSKAEAAGEKKAAATGGAAAGEKCESVYTFGKELGSGAYSQVFLCTHKKTKKQLAIKKITKSNLQPYDHDALKDEVRLLSKCEHSNIIGFEEFYDEAQHYYLVSEVVEGGELFDRICEKTVYNEAEARELAVCLLKTLDYLHKNTIAHRDLKPENLLLRSKTNDTDIVLADFGFAQETKGKNLQQVCGTPDYVAPEVIANEKYDFTCDIWSAGVIIFILLGGYPPFQAKDENDRDALFAIIKKGKFRFHEKFWKNISAEAKDLISGMLTVDVSTRLTAQQCLAHDWLKLEKSALEAVVIDTTALKEFNAKLKLKAAGKAVLTTVKLTKAVNAFSAPSSRATTPLPKRPAAKPAAS